MAGEGEATTSIRAETCAFSLAVLLTTEQPFLVGAQRLHLLLAPL